MGRTPTGRMMRKDSEGRSSIGKVWREEATGDLGKYSSVIEV